MHSSDAAVAALQPMPVPFQSLFPRTRYFEIDSQKAGARYAVWVTTPEAYDKSPDQALAAIYMPDGNWNVATAAGLCDLDQWDFIDLFQPTIQISVGYIGKDADLALAVRARDLLPPKEALSPVIENMDAILEAGLLDRAGADLYLHYLRNPAADRFLSFLTEELHPLIAETYRIRTDGVGLFGHSWGGLFAAYAALQRQTIFRNIGASSPGIQSQISVLFKMYADAAAAGDLPERNLHMTVAAREITDPGAYQVIVGVGTAEFMRTAGSGALKGLNFSARIFDNETHITVKPAAIYSFLRAYYLRSA
jgi:predicted alpha/beta superfamily hydrolase